MRWCNTNPTLQLSSGAQFVFSLVSVSTLASVFPNTHIILQVAAADIETRDEISDALDVLVQQIGRYREEAELFSAFPRVQESISRVYAQVLNYLVRATSYFSLPYSVRFSKAAFTLTRHKLKRIICSIEQESGFLDREVRAASEASKSDPSIIIAVKEAGDLTQGLVSAKGRGGERLFAF
jgi:hypothetical protein